MYLFDRTRNLIDTLFSDDENTYYNLQIMVLGGKFYITGDQLFLENTDRSDLSKWQPSEWDYGTPSFRSVIFKGNTAVAELSDSLRTVNYYRISVKKPTTVEQQTEVKKYYTTHFYAYPPYPIPAKNTVRTLAYWDLSFNLEKAILGVYTLYGNLISPKSKISINKVKLNAAHLDWDCGDVANGVYFIIISHNGIIDYIPVIVDK